MSKWVYDIEVYPNFFSATFIEAEQKNYDLLNAYKLADIKKDIILKNKILSKMNHTVFICADNSSLDNDLYRLIKFINKPNTWLFGFNSHNYDDIILSAIDYYSNTKEFKQRPNSVIKKLSDIIISRDFDRWTLDKESDLHKILSFRKPYISIDLQNLHGLVRLTSLKFVGVLYKWYRIQDLPYHFNDKLTSSQMEEVLDYNTNDVLITLFLLSKSKSELQSRIDAYNQYGIDSLSTSRAQFASQIIAYFYKKTTGKSINQKLNTHRTVVQFDTLISDKIEFQTKPFKDFLRKIATTTMRIGIDKFSFTLVHDDLSFNFAKGGIHSQERPIFFNQATEKYYLYIDCDVTSFYPSIILNNKISPKHFDRDIFLLVVKTMLDIRVEAKEFGKDYTLDEVIRLAFEKVANILKISINIMYGKLGDMYSFLYDLVAMYSVCINGELALLMLIEDLTINGYKVVSANTDGVVTKVNLKEMDKYYEICNKWEKKLNYNLEYNSYIQYYGKDVNNYMAQYSNSKWKMKGVFNTTPEKDDQYLKKGFEMPIINIALFNYFANGTDPSITIRNHKDIYDFCISPRIKSNYKVDVKWVENGIIKEDTLTKTNRFYISKKGIYITKAGHISKTLHGITKNIPRTISVIAKEYVTLFNTEFIHDNMEDYNIKYSYYIKSTWDYINTMLEAKTSIMKKQSGTLFD